MTNLNKVVYAMVAACSLALVSNGAAVATTLGVPQIAVKSLALLPQSVLDQAAVEAQDISDSAIITKAPIAPPSPYDGDARQSKTRGLATLVNQNAFQSSLNAEDKCLAAAVYFEAKGEKFEGQLAVAQVILNRVSSGRFASSVCGVVTQPGQFSFVRGGVIPVAPQNSKAWSDAVAISRIAQAKLHSSSAASALFFHAARVSPGWKRSRVAMIGNHIFYR